MTGPDEDKSANGTVRYNENVTAITESSTKPSHETIRYKTSLSSDNHTLTYDDVTGYTPQYGTHYDLSSTQTTKTEPNTTGLCVPLLLSLRIITGIKLGHVNIDT